MDFVHPDDHPLAAKALGELLDGGQHAGPFEMRLRDRDGVWIPVEVEASNLLDNRGRRRDRRRLPRHPRTAAGRERAAGERGATPHAGQEHPGRGVSLLGDARRTPTSS